MSEHGYGRNAGYWRALELSSDTIHQVAPSGCSLALIRSLKNTLILTQHNSIPTTNHQLESLPEVAPNPRALKLVHVMYRTLGSQMGPSDRLSDSGGSSWRQLVNSNLVSLSIVADSRYKFSPLKVDLAAPLELVLRHLEPLGSMGPPPSCVYWDSSLG